MIIISILVISVILTLAITLIASSPRDEDYENDFRKFKEEHKEHDDL